MSNEPAVRVRVVIHGRVQGVGFRYSCADMADDSAVSGWVRNRPDGTVEAVFEGSRDAVAAAVAWCAHGPAYAAVSGVETSDEQVEGLSGFRIP
ncbi:acylphosphatase [Planctomonas sp. JC2975]|uniref:acylphosphatase n=1 Tax=Planctomonas sp. JC2975 TaxID=2729626 RepID=UPI0014734F5C|nr:acylphosphatase [Planctomonas sp. JC2975]NNC11430.1 acylphosphatase [Planctomonas sp. JC2975]